MLLALGLQTCCQSCGESWNLLQIVQKSNGLVLNPAASWTEMISESFRQQTQKVCPVACLWKNYPFFLVKILRNGRIARSRGVEGKGSATAAVIL